MTKPIHHAITKRATKLGCAILTVEDGFRIEHGGKLSQDTFDTAKDAVDAFATGEMVFEPSKRNLCGVMIASYHDRYEHNPHGPGCGDGLDCAMRDAYTDPNGGVDRGGLESLGGELGLWNPRWGTLNNGMVRMNLTNRIRAMLRNDANAKVTLGGITGRFGVAYRPAKRNLKKAT